MQIAQSNVVKTFLYPFPRRTETFRPIKVLGLGFTYKHWRTGLSLCFPFCNVLNWDPWKQILRWEAVHERFAGGYQGIRKGGREAGLDEESIYPTMWLWWRLQKVLQWTLRL